APPTPGAPARGRGGLSPKGTAPAACQDPAAGRTAGSPRAATAASPAPARASASRTRPRTSAGRAPRSARERIRHSLCAPWPSHRSYGARPPELPGQGGRDLGQAGGGAVAVGQKRLGERPLDAVVRVVPGDPGLRGRVEVAGQLVGDVGLVAQHAEAVGEADGHVELAVVAVAELVALPAAEGGGAAPQVHG